MRYAPRRKLLVDRQVQGALLTRAFMYWLLFALAIFQLTIIFQVAKEPDRPIWDQIDLARLWHDHWVVAISGFIMLPALVLDTIFISNRMVGPLVRIRKTLRQLAAGESIRPIAFRQDDFFQALAAEVNAVAARMNRLTEDRSCRSETETELQEEQEAAGCRQAS